MTLNELRLPRNDPYGSQDINVYLNGGYLHWDCDGSDERTRPDGETNYAIAHIGTAPETATSTDTPSKKSTGRSLKQAGESMTDETHVVRVPCVSFFAPQRVKSPFPLLFPTGQAQLP